MRMILQLSKKEIHGGYLPQAMVYPLNIQAMDWHGRKEFNDFLLHFHGGLIMHLIWKQIVYGRRCAFTTVADIGCIILFL